MDRDIDFILNRDWPRWPILPMINRTDRSAGFLFDTAEHPFRVYIGNIYDERPIEFLPFLDYKTVEELAAEWRVD